MSHARAYHANGMAYNSCQRFFFLPLSQEQPPELLIQTILFFFGKVLLLLHFL